MRYTDPDGRKIVWKKDEGVSDNDFERVQQEAESLSSSDTEAGRRYKFLESTQDCCITITVTSSKKSHAKPSSYEDASNGIGSNSDVFIDLRKENKKLMV